MRNIFIPTSYRVRQQVLKVLFEQWQSGDAKNLSAPNRAITKEEISKKGRLNIKDVDQQLDYLFTTEDIHVIGGGDEPPKYIILPEGMHTYASRVFINDGKLLNSQIYNNYLNAIFQGTVAVIALIAIKQSFTTVEDLKAANKLLSTEVSHISTELRELRISAQAQSSSVDTKAKNQTNPQTDSTGTKKP
jgi:hypothetical protein